MQDKESRRKKSGFEHKEYLGKVAYQEIFSEGASTYHPNLYIHKV